MATKNTTTTTPTVDEDAPFGRNEKGQRLTKSGRIMRADLDSETRKAQDVNNRLGRVLVGIDSCGKIQDLSESEVNRLFDLIVDRSNAIREKMLNPVTAAAGTADLAASILG